MENLRPCEKSESRARGYGSLAESSGRRPSGWVDGWAATLRSIRFVEQALSVGAPSVGVAGSRNDNVMI